MSDRPYRVTLDEIAEQRKKGWPDFHPEDYCQRCGNRNAGSWCVESDRFCAAMDALGMSVLRIICPACFIEGHEKATGLTCTWELRPESAFRPIEGADDE